MSHPFPNDFLWGAATAAYQVEGNNINSDSWLMEHLKPTEYKEPSLDTCDQYHRYPQDLDLFAALGWNAYRFSIEWARIEPEEGCFSRAETEHYRRMLAACHERGLKPVVTFHHITSPRWLISAGGWQDEKVPARFAKYCGYVARELGDLLDICMTINQPNLARLMMMEGYTPKVETLENQPWFIHAAQAFGVPVESFRPHLYASTPHDVELQLESHRCAVDAIKSARSELRTGWTVLSDSFQAEPGGESRVEEIRSACVDEFLEASRDDDIVGVQTYSRLRFGPDGILPPPEGAEITDAYGWEFYPAALEETIRYFASKISTPLIVTENGIAARDDSRRVEWIRQTVPGLRRCIADGIDLRGYLYWSAMDNFEWLEGYTPRFGLIEVDRSTLERRPKESAHYLGQVARSNGEI
jgi:beta-glucosidase